MPSEARFIEEWLEGELGLPMCPCAAQDLHRAYYRWCCLALYPTSNFLVYCTHGMGRRQAASETFLQT